MSERLDWTRDGADWPNRAASRFVAAAGMVWHVQVMGQGPAILLLHGTGASTHSWRDVLPRVADRFTVVAPDLPGHGFSSDAPASAQSLPGMASAVSDLLRKLGIAPFRAVGHSAGSAVAVRMAALKSIRPEDLVSFNGAFFPVSGVAGHFFTPLARAAAATRFMPRLFAAMADEKAVDRLLKDTGSAIDARGRELYQRLFADEAHVAGTLRMMAAWDLHWTEQDLRNLPCPLFLVRALGDRTIPPRDSERAAALCPNARIITLSGLGHLAHEENPALAAEIIGDPAGYLLRNPG
jgi:magnesium chelatase accessory protein